MRNHSTNHDTPSDPERSGDRRPGKARKIVEVHVQKRVESMPDGRYLIYYTFSGLGDDPEADDPRAMKADPEEDER